jgi:DNA-binding IclR family transcriptional regulator
MSQTVDRALSILAVLAERPHRINEVAEHLGVHHSTALRLLHTLRGRGLVKELPDHSYRLGPATFRLAFTALDGIDLRSVARPYMQRLNAQTGETVHLGTLEGDDVVYIDKVDARNVVRLHSSIGGIATLHCTAVSKAILAFLPIAERERLLASHSLTRLTEHTLSTVEELTADLERSRERGYVLDAEENEPGIHCVGAPIVGPDDAVVGALSVTAPMSRLDRDALVALAPAVIAASGEASRELGWRGAPT